MGCHFLLQGIFPTRGWNLSLLRWQEDSLPESPRNVTPAGPHIIQRTSRNERAGQVYLHYILSSQSGLSPGNPYLHTQSSAFLGELFF